MRSLRIVLLGLAVMLGAAAAPRQVAPVYPVVKAGPVLSFPRDHGAHPDYRTEWWYVTGWLKTADGQDLGFQVTFFRTRPAVDQANPSAFSPKQILFAHAALSDPKLGRLSHDQRVARQGFGLAEASATDTHIVLDDWTLIRGGDGRYTTHVAGQDFVLDLTLAPSQPPLLQGQAGYSRKGPKPAQASYYYTLPHLKVTGLATRAGKPARVTGEAWLDREWSSTLLDPAAVGWDWTGLNLDDGSALTAFQVRDAAGKVLWAGGSLRAADGTLTHLGPGEVAFATDRRWKSPRTGADYPVGRTLSLKLGGAMRAFKLTPLFDDQELDSRRGGGPVYWEGAVRTGGGRGYLELTGYLSPLKM
ncbi:carotenoid 1,2-hydratase [Phenylobacterium aquaticum]|uniref:lipocalin-like domain-containing protein n=1 Tax=Phenylobacterium aquaticum TaxID=1763816 RepID=UPI0026F278A7|nr:carotenoid 1,2-hydratase [Phenylobacterium aquaticum]